MQVALQADMGEEGGSDLSPAERARCVGWEGVA